MVLVILAAAAIIMTQKPGSSFDFDEFAAEERLMNSDDPAGLLKEYWASGFIPQRRFAVLNARNKILDETQNAYSDFFYGTVMPHACLDPDIQIRELTLSALSRVHAVKRQAIEFAQSDDTSAQEKDLEEFEKKYFLPACAVQLDDPDPQVRAMGIRYARPLKDKAPLVSAIAANLPTPNAQLLGQTASFLQMATGQDFGIRLKDISKPDSAIPQSAITEKISRWTEFLAQDPDKWKSAAASITPFSIRIPHLSHDYMALKLKSMDGRDISLGTHGRKVVILSFWTTWCTPCIDELPALSAIQKNMGDKVRIIAISLDGAPSIHGIKDDNGEFIDDQVGKTEANREKILSLLETSGVELDVVWDQSSSIAARYKGDELPTHAIYDPSGHLVRVFTGSRSGQEWEKIIGNIHDNPVSH